MIMGRPKTWTGKGCRSGDAKSDGGELCPLLSSAWHLRHDRGKNKMHAAGATALHATGMLHHHDTVLVWM